MIRLRAALEGGLVGREGMVGMPTALASVLVGHFSKLLGEILEHRMLLLTLGSAAAVIEIIDLMAAHAKADGRRAALENSQVGRARLFAFKLQSTEL